MPDVSVNSDGMVILAGVYQLFPLKNLWIWLLSGCASSLSYLITSKDRKLSATLIFFCIGLFVLFIAEGIANDVFGKGIPLWVGVLLGFMSNPLLKKFLDNTDLIVEALYSKIMNKLGIEVREKHEEEDENAKPSN